MSFAIIVAQVDSRCPVQSLTHQVPQIKELMGEVDQPNNIYLHPAHNLLKGQLKQQMPQDSLQYISFVNPSTSTTMARRNIWSWRRI